MISKIFKNKIFLTFLGLGAIFIVTLGVFGLELNSNSKRLGLNQSQRNISVLPKSKPVSMKEDKEGVNYPPPASQNSEPKDQNSQVATVTQENTQNSTISGDNQNNAQKTGSETPSTLKGSASGANLNKNISSNSINNTNSSSLNSLKSSPNQQETASIASLACGQKRFDPPFVPTGFTVPGVLSCTICSQQICIIPTGPFTPPIYLSYLYDGDSKICGCGVSGGL